MLRHDHLQIPFQNVFASHQGRQTHDTCMRQREQAMSTKCEMVGFDIPDVFVVGYGLDFNDEFRNMPFVGVLGEDGIRERSPR